jgi:predicted peroxiredoxin
MAERLHRAASSADRVTADRLSEASPSSGFVRGQMDGLAILLWSAEPAAPERLATPFFHAAAAAAMDLEVEIFFSARSVGLLEPGVAERLRPNPSHPKTVLDSIREAVSLGARLYACSDALRAHGLADRPLIDECTERGGAVQFVARVADPRWRALVF